MKLTDCYRERLSRRSDIAVHLPCLRGLAAGCTHVTEFGVRCGNSTVALLDGLRSRDERCTLISYDIAPARFEPPELPPVLRWEFRQQDTAALEDIDPTDLLFIDTLHTCAQVQAELRHARRVRRHIILHDTITFGSQGEHGQPGITQAIYEFLEAQGHAWRVHSHDPRSHGLLVLKRRAA